MIGLGVADAREVEPLGMAELVALEVEPALAAQTVGQQADHLVKGQAAVDDGRERRQRRHVRVHLGVHEPEGDRLVAHERLVVALHVGDVGLLPSAVLERVHDVAEVPVLVLGLLEQLDPLVGQSHGQTVVEARAALLHRTTQCRHARHVLPHTHTHNTTSAF